MPGREVLDVVRSHRERLKSFGVRRIALFGSAARNELTETSDLDFLVEFERKTFDAYMDTKEFLESTFGRRVDLVVPESLKPRLRPSVMAEAIYAPGF